MGKNAAWADITPRNNVPRNTFRPIHIPTEDRVLIFSQGNAAFELDPFGTNPDSEIWSFDLTTDTFTGIRTAIQHPVLVRPSVVHDSGNDRFFLIGEAGDSRYVLQNRDNNFLDMWSYSPERGYARLAGEEVRVERDFRWHRLHAEPGTGHEPRYEEPDATIRTEASILRLRPAGHDLPRAARP